MNEEMVNNNGDTSGCTRSYRTNQDISRQLLNKLEPSVFK